MPTLTIPKTITKRDLMVVPRKEYEWIMRFLSMISKDQVWFWTRKWQDKESEADADIKTGRVSRNYKTAKELKKALTALKISK